MMSHRVTRRVTQSWLAVLAVAAMGADPAPPWVAARPSLPPVVDTPRVLPAPPPVQGRPISSAPLPLPLAPRLDQRPVAPAQSLTPPTLPSMPQAVAAPNTHVFVLNGLDPFGWAGLSRMTDRIRESGFPDTRYGGWYQVLQFDREIRALHRQDPSSQIVIIGYSLGVYRAKALANRLTRDGIPVAMVGYIGGDYLRNSPSNMPNGAKVVNVTGDGYLLTGKNLFFNGTQLSGADNVRMPGVRHFGLPKQEQTLNALVNGIHASTGGWTGPAVANTNSAVPGGIAVGPEVLPQRSAASPISTTGRR